MVISTGASHSWYALMCGQEMQQFWRSLNAVMYKASEKVSVYEADGALANTKLNVHREKLANLAPPFSADPDVPNRELTAYGGCHLHANKIV